MNQEFIRIGKPKRRLLNPEYIPTPLTPREERTPIRVLELDQHRRLGGLTVIARFAGFGLRMLGRKLQGRRDARLAAIEARQLFQGLGGLWIKLGQLLSLRSDIFSDEMCEELSQLLYSNIGFPAQTARQAIERELGLPVEAVFSTFEDQPLAAASIAQVHRAVLRKEGVAVVVKLLRPNVTEAFRRDMALLRGAVKILGLLMPLRHLRLNEGMAELNAMVEEELNYAYEASNSRQLRNVLRRHNVYVPYLFRQYCTEKILVMEEIAGVLMSEAIAVKSNDPERFAEWCEENAVRPRQVAAHLFFSNLRQLLEDNLFHGDMHPGNIILLRNNRYALIDFGTIGSLDPDFLKLYLGMLRAVSRREYDRAADLSIHLCQEVPSFDIDKMRSELIAAFKLWQARSELHNLSYHDRSLGASSKIIGQVFAKYRLQVNWAALRVGRTWGTLDTSLAYFYPGMNHLNMFSRYFKQANRRRREHALEDFGKGLAHMAETADQYRVLLGPVVQRSIITYKQTMSKYSLMAATVMRFLYWATLLSIAFVAHVYLHQHYPGIGDYPGAAIAKLVPLMEQEWFLLALAGLGVVSVLVRRLLKIVSSAYLR